MKSILLIGLGRFGLHIASKLSELGHQVMAVDKSEERINKWKSQKADSVFTAGSISRKH